MPWPRPILHNLSTIGTNCYNFNQKKKSCQSQVTKSNKIPYFQVSAFHKQHRGQNAEEAMLEYLKIAQDLEMFGIGTTLV